MSANKIQAGGIIKLKNLCLLGVMAAPDRPGIGAEIFEALGDARLSAQFIVQCIDLSGNSSMLFCVPEEDSQCARDRVQPIAANLGALAVQETHHVALLSIFGPDFREKPGIAGTVFRALAAHQINMLATSTSISTISCVISGEDLDQALLALQEAVILP